MRSDLNKYPTRIRELEAMYERRKSIRLNLLFIVLIFSGALLSYWATALLLRGEPKAGGLSAGGMLTLVLILGLYCLAWLGAIWDLSVSLRANPIVVDEKGVHPPTKTFREWIRGEEGSIAWEDLRLVSLSYYGQDRWTASFVGGSGRKFVLGSELFGEKASSVLRLIHEKRSADS